jgi:DNA-binding response OmpR family regulator
VTDRIVLVDADRIKGPLLAYILEQEGYKVSRCTTVTKAARLLRAGNVSLVLARAPDGTVPGALERLVELSEDIPLVLFGASPVVQRDARVRAALPAPLNTEALLACIADVLARRPPAAVPVRRKRKAPDDQPPSTQ